MKLFVDSSAFIALADRSDQDHKAAEDFFRECAPEAQVHTSNYIVAETITRLRRTARHHAAAQWTKAVFESRQTTRHYVDAETELEAVQVFERYRDHFLSFTDCTTIVLLRRLRLDRIFSFDQDFRRLGYALLPGALR